LWLEEGEGSEWLKALSVKLPRDCGIHLETSLFYYAIYHFHGSADGMARAIEVELKHTQ